MHNKYRLFLPRCICGVCGGVNRLLNLHAPALGGNPKIVRTRAKRKDGESDCLYYLF